MKILGIDTATECCSVAIAPGDGHEIDEIQHITPNGHSRMVPGMVRELLNKHQLNLTDLDALSVDIGPGSFTGLRIGIGVVQGLAYAAGIRTVGVSSLDALAGHCPDGFSVSAIDARMKQVYWAVFEKRGGEPRKLAGPFVTAPEQIGNMFSEVVKAECLMRLNREDSIFAVGNGWDHYSCQLPSSVGARAISVIEKSFPLASQIVQLALRADQAAFRSPLELAAAYVRNKVADRPAEG